jgi:hypothetical protein
MMLRNNGFHFTVSAKLISKELTQNCGGGGGGERDTSARVPREYVCNKCKLMLD